MRQAKASRFGRQSGQEAKEVAARDSNENMEIVEEAEKLAEESPFIDLEAYKGQDDRQAKSLRVTRSVHTKSLHPGTFLYVCLLM